MTFTPPIASALQRPMHCDELSPVSSLAEVVNLLTRKSDLVCPYCSKQFLITKRVNEHIRRYHPAWARNKVPRKEVIEERVPEPTKKRFAEYQKESEAATAETQAISAAGKEKAQESLANQKPEFAIIDVESIWRREKKKRKGIGTLIKDPPLMASVCKEYSKILKKVRI